MRFADHSVLVGVDEATLLALHELAGVIGFALVRGLLGVGEGDRVGPLVVQVASGALLGHENVFVVALGSAEMMGFLSGFRTIETYTSVSVELLNFFGSSISTGLVGTIYRCIALPVMSRGSILLVDPLKIITTIFCGERPCFVILAKPEAFISDKVGHVIVSRSSSSIAEIAILCVAFETARFFIRLIGLDVIYGTASVCVGQIFTEDYAFSQQTQLFLPGATVFSLVC